MGGLVIDPTDFNSFVFYNFFFLDMLFSPHLLDFPLGGFVEVIFVRFNLRVDIFVF